MKAKRASGFVPISRSTASAVESLSSAMIATRSKVRFAWSIVVSRKSRIGISPRPLNRLTSIAPRPVKRRNGQIKVPFFNQFWRLPVEKRDEERGNMSAVDVRVSHDDDLVVAKISR